MRFKTLVSIVLCYVIALPVFGQTPEISGGNNNGIWYGLTRNYRPTPVLRISFEDSPRLEKLIRADRIYLSLRDAIALALENNLDIESARLTPKLQDVNLMRASAASLLRNVSSSVTSGPSSA